MPRLGRALGPLIGGQGRRAVLAVLGMTATVAVLLTAVMAARAPLPGRGVAAGTPLRVGVAEGESIPAYVAAARDRLATLPDKPTFALVSLAAYVAPERLGVLFEQAAPNRVYLRVPLPGLATEIITVEVRQLPRDVVAAMDSAAGRKESDAEVAEKLAKQLTGDTPRERELRQEYRGRAAQASAEATAYREHCSCVYAAVVRAAPPALAELSKRPGIRAVDPTPGLGRLEQAVFLPPMPEQQTVAADPADPAAPASPAPVPSPAPSPSAKPSPSPSPSPSPEPSPSPQPTAPPTGPMPPWPPSPAPASPPPAPRPSPS